MKGMESSKNSGVNIRLSETSLNTSRKYSMALRANGTKDSAETSGIRLNPTNNPVEASPRFDGHINAELVRA